MKFYRTMTAALMAAALALSASSVLAQVPSLPNSPYNVSITNPDSNTPPSNKVLTLTAQAAATVESNIINNIAYNGVVCTFNQTAHVGVPTTLLSIRSYDAASASTQQLVVSGSITADATPTSVMVYPGVSLTTTPTGMVIQALKLPRYFKVRAVVSTASGSTTGTVGCDLLK